MNSKQIILLHGALGASDQLLRLANELNKNGFQTFLFNFSGHGKTDFLQQFNIAQFANELENFISENKIINPNVFGYSMGGYVALYLAKHKPELINKIITLGTKFKWTKEISEKEIQNLIPEAIEQKIPKFALALNERHGEQWKKLLQKTADMMLEMGERNPLELSDFKLIKNKVLIGLAENDQMVSKEETEEVYKTISGAKFYLLTGAKHPIETVDAKLLSEIIKNFIY